jgi:hypothetical protein
MRLNLREIQIGDGGLLRVCLSLWILYNLRLG